MYNEMDPCCFRVSLRDPFIDYVAGVAQHNGTVHSVFVDHENTQHSIGPAGYQALAGFLARTAP